jgi:ABC-type lipoprotein release transport system permease subunit
MLLRFQCSKSKDNPKIYVSSAARQLLASFLPARRAASVNPVDALRAE